MNDNNLKDLKALVDEVIYSSTKSSAKDPVARLEFMASSLDGDIDSYYFEKLNDVIIYAKEASGQVGDKQHWINNVNNAWHIFYNGVSKQ
jgi:hypothetical protein